MIDIRIAHIITRPAQPQYPPYVGKVCGACLLGIILTIAFDVGQFGFLFGMVIFFLLVMMKNEEEDCTDWDEAYEMKGDIIIDPGMIKINDGERASVIKCSDITSLRLTSNYYNGYHYNDGYGDGTTYMGCGKFEIQAAGKKYSFCFMLQTGHQYIDLRQILTEWYISGMNIKETEGTVLMNRHPKYKDHNYLKEKIAARKAQQR